MPDIERLQQLSRVGDKHAVTALAEYAKRSSNFGVIPIEALLLRSEPCARAHDVFALGALIPSRSYPEHLQDICPQLACCLYRLEHGLNTVILGKRSRYARDRIYASTTQTPAYGKRAGGWRLHLMQHTETNIQAIYAVNNISCKQARLEFASNSMAYSVETLVRVYRLHAYTRRGKGT